ncbi:hypothetical protein [Streptomyces europaeiscabiei]|uniref:hypothetical protein n=1 Tax=Streptomyces europaeiscabiei TaxID=146819 RepID=UPI002E1661E7|nr:baseplate J/gp47 family protein [Streptomyces europaeiscabiei]
MTDAHERPQARAAGQPVGFSPVAGLDRDARKALIAAARGLDGIDFVEVLPGRPAEPGRPGTSQQRTLAVHLVQGPVPAWLTGGAARDRIVLAGTGNDPMADPARVLWAYSAEEVTGPDPLPGVTRDDRRQVDDAVPAGVRSRVLVVRTEGGGRSVHTLALVGEDGTGTPQGIDGPLAQIPLDFGAECPVELDCRTPDDAPGTAASPVLDYLARDYEGLRTRLLDRLSVLLPDWTDRSPADIGVTLIELFAYLGDRLAYRQDAIATEAYLSTARLRTSVRRHARLLDHRMHEGCSARTWLAFDTPTTTDLPRGSAVADRGSAPGRRPPPVAEAAGAGAVVFETCAAARLSRDRNRLPLHAWGAREVTLPVGATSAFVAVPADADPGLRAGDVLLLVDVGASGGTADGDPARRCAVRLDRDPAERVDTLLATRRVLELHWHEGDALPVELRVSTPEPTDPRPTTVAFANVVLADHGASLTGQHLDPPSVADGAYRPVLRRPGLSWAEPADPAPVGDTATGRGWRSATEALRPDPREAVAQLMLDDGTLRWTASPDLIGSGCGAALFVAEPEADRTVRLRFGDGTTGRRPGPGAVLTARYRLGGGTAGNTGPDTLTTLLPLPDGTLLNGIAVTNPLAASGGTDPQPLPEVRELAPNSFHLRRRAVTAADYTAVVLGAQGVRRAASRSRWAGSWHVQQVVVDVEDGADPFAPGLAGLLDTRRTAGVEVELARAVVVPLDLRIAFCPAPGHLAEMVARQLRTALSAAVLPAGGRGFFHPDRLALGRPLLLSDLVGVAMAVVGTALVEVQRFARLGAGEAEHRANLAAGRIRASERETLRCDSDPRRPRFGQIEIVERSGP